MRSGCKVFKMAASSWLNLCRSLSARISLLERQVLTNFTPLTLSYDIPTQDYSFGDFHVDGNSEKYGFLWMAVPKKKTTPSKKKLRHQHKWLKNRTDIETCVVCGNHKLIGHLCGHCLEKINKKTREYRLENKEDEKHWPVPEILKKFRLY